MEIKPDNRKELAEKGMYEPTREHDACGLGFLVNINGEKTHSIISGGVSVLKNLLHRGATGADDKTGDGAGLQFQIPHLFFKKIADESGWELPSPGYYGAGMFFLPADKTLRDKYCETVNLCMEEAGLKVTGWRDVPVVPESIGGASLEKMPFIAQCFVDGCGLYDSELERKLYIARKDAESRVASLKNDDQYFYAVSLSCRTIVYKGLLMPDQVEQFYPDLTDPLVESAFVIVHQRYSTNTFPSWSLAQPFRYLCHNGEINTLRGNRNWMASRKEILSLIFSGRISKRYCRYWKQG
jgi:glutamate synthase (NADPH) large chain